MNDRYLCRAKRTDNGEWVEGYYAVKGVEEFERHNIVVSTFNEHTSGYPFYFTDYEVDPSTICQCSGKHDKYYNRIFENDIVKVKGVLYVCRFDEDNFAWEFQNHEETIGICCFHSSDIEITGNAIDNQELLEVGE